MGAYYYEANSPIEAKRAFWRDKHRNVLHYSTCNDGRYLLFDTEDSYQEWRLKTFGPSIDKTAYVEGTIFTEADARIEIEQKYGDEINKALSERNFDYPLLFLGVHAIKRFGDSIIVKFCKSDKEEDVVYRYYIHYTPVFFDVNPNISNERVKEAIIQFLFNHFYDSQFKKRIERIK